MSANLDAAYLERRARRSKRSSDSLLHATRSSLPQPQTPKRSRDTPADDYMCVICLSTVVDAHQTGCCGALLCNGCCKTVSAAQSRCPNCRHEQATFHKDAFRERMAAALVLTCDTCGFSAKRDEYLAHVATGHETPEVKIARLEVKLKESEQNLAKSRAEVTQLERRLETQDQAIQRTMLSCHSLTAESIIKLCMTKRFKGSVFCRTVQGASGNITVIVSTHFQVTLNWSHFNVALTVQRIRGTLQGDKKVTVHLAHLDHSQDRVDNFTLTPTQPTKRLQNWMSLEQLKQHRTSGKSISFAVNVPADT